MPISADIPANKVHDYWIGRVLTAYRRLSRSKKEAEWSRWARMADLDDYDKLNFTEPARRDLKLDIIGDRPAIKIEAQRAQDADIEDAMTKLCSLEISRPENWKAIKRVVNDAGLAGIGWLRADWYTVEEAAVEDNGKSEAENTASANAHLGSLMAGQPVPVAEDDAHRIHAAIEGAALSTFGLTTAQKQLIREHVKEHEAYLPVNNPAGFRLQRVHPGNMLFDDTADEWEKCEWVAERTVERVEDVKANPEYKNTSKLTGQPEVRRRGYRRTGRRLATGSGRPVDTAFRQGAFTGQEEDMYVILWHIHDLRENELIVVAEDNPEAKPLKKEPWPYDGTIYYPLVFDNESDGIEGISDYRRMYYPTKQRANIQERWVAHLGQHSRRKVLAEEGFVDPAGEAALNDPNRTVVPVVSLAKYRVMDDVPINRDAYAVDDRMRENVARSIGVGEPQQGVGGQTGSATEANLMEGSRGRIVRERRSLVGDMLEWVCRRVLNYYASFGTTALFLAKGVSPNDDVVLEPADITEDVTITVDNDALSAANAELDRQLVRQAIEVINAAPWMIQILGTQGRIEVASKFLRTQRVLSNPDAIIKQGVAEMQLLGQMLPPQAAVRAGAGSTESAPGMPGQQTGNMSSQLMGGQMGSNTQQGEGNATV
jgi:hypothetical protein